MLLHIPPPLWLESIPQPGVLEPQVTAAVQLAPSQLGPEKLASPHGLFVRAAVHLVLFPVPTTAASAPSSTHPPSRFDSPSSSLSPFLLLFPSPNKYTFSLLLRIFWMVESLLTEPSCSPPGETQEEGVIVVMISLPFSRIGLWGHKCGSARGCPTLSAPTGTSLTVTVLPRSQWHCLDNTDSFFFFFFSPLSRWVLFSCFSSESYSARAWWRNTW